MKVFFSLLIAILMILPLAACAKEPVTATDSASSQSPKPTEKNTDIASDKPTETSSALPSETDSSSQKTDSKSDKTVTDESDKPTSLPDAGDLFNLNFNEGNYVIATNQKGNTLNLYAVDFYDKNLESCEIWSLELKNHGDAVKCVSGVKYRENTVYGNVVTVACSGGFAGIYKFPSKKEVWSVDSCGNNPHSIEILPNGAIVTAASSGHEIRIYDTSVQGAAGLCGTYYLEAAHAVLWDPQTQILWGLGQKLIAYTFTPNGAKGGTLQEKKVYSIAPNTSGHELSADMLNPDFLLLTTYEGILRFNKKTETFATVEGLGGPKACCTGYGNNKLGNTFYSYGNSGPGTSWANASFHTWCTDRIYYYQPKAPRLNLRQLVSENCAFYKVFSFCGKYQ